MRTLDDDLPNDRIDRPTKAGFEKNFKIKERPSWASALPFQKTIIIIDELRLDEIVSTSSNSNEYSPVATTVHENPGSFESARH